MANIDNAQIFRKHRIPNRENTLFMVYRAERLYSALGDATKVCKHLVQHLYDSGDFEIVAAKDRIVEKDDEKFIRKREILIKRLQAQVSNFLSQYGIFGDRFQYKEKHMKEFLQAELAKARECRMLFDQSKQLESNELNALSSRVGAESNNREIVELPPTPEPVIPPRIPGVVSPYNSKVAVPDDLRTSRRSKDSRLKSGKSKDDSLRMKSARSIKKKMSCMADGVAVRSSKQSKISSKDPAIIQNIIEEEKGMHRSRQQNAARYNEIQNNNGLEHPSRDIDSSAIEEDGQTIRTLGNKNQGTNARSPGGRYAITQRDPMLEQNPMADADSDYDDRANVNFPPAVGSGVPPISGLADTLTEGKTEYTQLTKGAQHAANIKDQSTQVYQKRVSPRKVILEQKGKMVTPRAPKHDQL